MLASLNLICDCVAEAEQQFHSALDPSFRVASHEIIGESPYRGGFSPVFANGSCEVQVSYGDLGRKLPRTTSKSNYAVNWTTATDLR